MGAWTFLCKSGSVYENFNTHYLIGLVMFQTKWTSCFLISKISIPINFTIFRFLDISTSFQGNPVFIMMISLFPLYLVQTIPNTMYKWFLQSVMPMLMQMNRLSRWFALVFVSFSYLDQNLPVLCSPDSISYPLPSFCFYSENVVRNRSYLLQLLLWLQPEAKFQVGEYRNERNKNARRFSNVCLLFF